MDVKTLGLRVDANGAIQEVRKFNTELKVAASTSEKVVQAQDKVAQSYNRVASSARGSSAAVAQRVQSELSAARQMHESLERQFRMDQAKLREDQARGLLNQQQAREAGRLNAVAYNDGVLSVLSKGQGAGAFRGADGSAAYATIAGSIKDVTGETAKAAVGMGTLRSAMATVTTQALMMAPGVAAVGGVLGTMAIGAAMMVGVLAAVAALGYAWRKLTEDARELNKAAKEAAESTRDAWMQMQTAGDITLIDLGSTLAARRQQLVDQQREKERLSRTGSAAQSGTSVTLAAEAAAIGVLITKQDELIAQNATMLNLRRTTRQEAENKNASGGGTKAEADAIAVLAARVRVEVEAYQIESMRAKAVENATALQGELTKALSAGNVSRADELRLNQQLLEIERLRATESQRVADAAAVAGITKTGATGVVGPSGVTFGGTGVAKRLLTDPRYMEQWAAEQAKVAERFVENMTRSMQEGLSGFFTGLVTEGVSSFRTLFDRTKDMFLRMIADMGSARLTKGMAGGLAGLMGALAPEGVNAQGIGGLGTVGTARMGAGLAGLGVGYGVGRSIGGVGGMLAGAGAGALAGSMIAPGVGTAIGAIAGFAGAVMGAGEAARKAAEQQRQLRDSFNATLDKIRSDMSGGSGLDKALVSLRIEMQALLEQAKQTYGGRDSRRAGAINEVVAIWEQREAQLRAEAAALEELAKQEAERARVLQEIAELEARRTREVRQQEVTNDIFIRTLRANGMVEEADRAELARSQAAELTQAIQDGMDAATLAALQFLHAAEAAAIEAQKVEQSTRRREDLLARGADAAGFGAFASDLRFTGGQRRELADAQRDGWSVADIELLKTTQMVERAQRDQQKVVAAQTKVIEDAAAAEQSRLDEQIHVARESLQVAQDAIRTQEQAVKDTQRAIESLTRFSAGLVLGPSTVLSPAAQLAEARRQYDAQLALARGGDRDAAGNLPGIAQSLLDASRGYNASNSGYGNDFAYVQRTVAEVTAMYGAQLTTEQKILEELIAQSATLQAQIEKLQEAKTVAEQQAQTAIAALNATLSLPEMFRLMFPRQPDPIIVIDYAPPPREIFGPEYWANVASVTPDNTAELLAINASVNAHGAAHTALLSQIAAVNPRELYTDWVNTQAPNDYSPQLDVVAQNTGSTVAKLQEAVEELRVGVATNRAGFSVLSEQLGDVRASVDNVANRIGRQIGPVEWVN